MIPIVKRGLLAVIGCLQRHTFSIEAYFDLNYSGSGTPDTLTVRDG